MVKKDFIGEGHLLFSLPGINRLNLMVAREMRTELNNIPEKGEMKITLDLEGIHFIDSTGFDFLVETARKAELCRFDFELIHVLPEVTELIKLLHLENILGTGETTLKSCI